MRYSGCQICDVARLHLSVMHFVSSRYYVTLGAQTSASFTARITLRECRHLLFLPPINPPWLKTLHNVEQALDTRLNVRANANKRNKDSIHPVCGIYEYSLPRVKMWSHYIYQSFVNGVRFCHDDIPVSLLLSYWIFLLRNKRCSEE